jgi:DNA-binding transcriptional ArsR family regulator
MRDVAAFFKILADPNRLRMALLLEGGELFVCQLMGILGISQPLMSRNLRQLEQTGLVRSRRRGKLVFYTMRRDLSPLRQAVVTALKREAESDELCRRDRRYLQLMRDRFQQAGADGRCDMALLRQFLAFKEQENNESNDKEMVEWKN